MIDPSLAPWAARAVFLAHLAFVAFAAGGGLLSLRWPRVAWLHLPALAWAVSVECAHAICPLTPLEQSLWRIAGEAGYTEGFVEHYLVPLLYPPGLTHGTQLAIAAILVAVNATAYAIAIRRASWRRQREA